ncbi:MAG: decaprenyl-phosphate phosphoribosyltransferase [Candidatus Kryptonium sp.]|nr:decaprenyl-phosphate phosphoribosyltransferase [Candidatus Kryptonium sp.]MCX7763241.1 decaprenyl-phosphate phosphoribosyltransferase [Candidatus Kryptonium sp.]MDW8108106.1 decaprenyl-phosphate phosphoribosyltransferase [Candidatus Kryptonium sp.]
MGLFFDYIKLARPKQWIKNFFVFAPLIFSHHLLNFEKVKISIFAFLAFSFIASSVYVINDIVDRESDKLHPVKKNRPIASGRVGILQGFLFSIFLFFVGLALLFELPFKAGFLIILYFVMMLLYSLKLKQVVLVDVFVIAIGFMLRVLVGAYAIEVVVSKWLFITTLFLSLFLAISKRRMEIYFSIQNPNSGLSEQRKVLDEYNIKFADQMLVITAGGAVISYALYTISERTVLLFGTEALIYTTIFVLYGIFRYMYLIYQKKSGENPTDVILGDWGIIANIFLWFIVCVVIIYRKQIFKFIGLTF